MLLSEVQTRVTKQFGDVAGAVITTDDIARWATDAQLDIVRKTKLNQTDTTTASVALQSRYVIANMLEVQRVTYNGVVIKMISRAELDSRFPGRGATGYGTDTPSYWAYRENGIEVFPTPPDNLGIITVTHTKRPAPVVVPTDVFEIPEQYHEAIVRRCLERAYETDGQWNAADRMKADVELRTNDAAHDRATGGGDSFPAVRALPGDGGDW
jgi:hypothetical protein